MIDVTQLDNIKKEQIYMASVNLLRMLLIKNQYDRKVLERLNVLNAKTMNCRVVALS